MKTRALRRRHKRRVCKRRRRILPWVCRRWASYHLQHVCGCYLCEKMWGLRTGIPPVQRAQKQDFAEQLEED